ncbi:hypothetical protein AB205_0114230 [Aquarana catesbeiana]|uniref:Nucleoporin NUP53 n=1 Tax=Aquarana catesbeiana TaxID=8400 RepID=A0A2G9REA4_AQUCT|nr:hypothetical protein AB205_0114230 [Aquarana catesbeiana]
MALGSPTSPKPGVGAQFLPGFLMGDIPTPVTPQPRPSMGVMELRSPMIGGGSPHQPVLPSHKDKSGAPPVRSLYDDISSPGLGSTPLNSRKLQPSFSTLHTPLSGAMPSTPGATSSVFSPATINQSRKATLSPAQLDPFYTQGDALTSEDQLDDTWVTVYGMAAAAAENRAGSWRPLPTSLDPGTVYVYSNFPTGNWMHVQYQSKLQARKALSKDGKIFGDCIMIGVKPCIDKSIMESGEKTSLSSVNSVFTPPIKTLGTPTQAVSTPRSTMRPLAAAYKASTSEYQVLSDKQTPKKDEGLVSKAMEYVFGW